MNEPHTSNAKISRKPQLRLLPDPLGWIWILMILVMVGGFFFPVIGLAVPFCILGAVLMAPFAGRKWCGTICPRGKFLDRVLAVYAPSRKMPDWSRSLGAKLAVLAFFGIVTGLRIPPVWGDWAAVGGVFVWLLTGTTIVAVLLGWFTHPRVWCSVCPAGTMGGWISRSRPMKVKLSANKCRSCNICNNSCLMDIKPEKLGRTDKASHPDCLNCGVCTGVCPVGAMEISYGKNGNEKSSSEKNQGVKAA